MENKNLREGNDYGGPTLSFGQECVLNLGECKVKVKEGVNFHYFKKKPYYPDIRVHICLLVNN